MKLQDNHHIVLWAIFLLAFGLRAWGLSDQPPLEDEISAAYSALNYTENGLWSLIMWEHPPLRNVILSATGKIWGGYSAWGLRGGSILLGSLSVPLLGYLAHVLFRNRMITYLCSFFLCIDPLHIALSRQAFQEAMTPCLILAGVISACAGMKRDSLSAVYLSGIFFGLASASKWHGLFPWAVSGLAYLFWPWLRKGEGSESRLFPRLLNFVVGFGVIPLVSYTAVFIPWLNRGYSLTEFMEFQRSLVSANYAHQASAYAESFLLHRAYLWFLWPMAWADFVFHEGRAYLNVAMGNLLVWVLTLPALYYAIRKWIREKEFETGFIVLLFLISYLPLVFTSRGIWVFSAPAVLPFAFILTAYAISGLLESGRISRRVLVSYLVAVSLLSALMYPLSTFRALEYGYLKPVTELYSPHGQDHFAR